MFATVEVKEVVATPLALVVVDVVLRLPPLPLVMAKDTASLAIGVVLSAYRSVRVIVDDAIPLGSRYEVGLALTVGLIS